MSAQAADFTHTFSHTLTYSSFSSAYQDLKFLTYLYMCLCVPEPKPHWGQGFCLVQCCAFCACMREGLALSVCWQVPRSSRLSSTCHCPRPSLPPTRPRRCSFTGVQFATALSCNLFSQRPCPVTFVVMLNFSHLCVIINIFVTSTNTLYYYLLQFLLFKLFKCIWNRNFMSQCKWKRKPILS